MARMLARASLEKITRLAIPCSYLVSFDTPNLIGAVGKNPLSKSSGKSRKISVTQVLNVVFSMV
jgi:hypothetical protein